MDYKTLGEEVARLRRARGWSRRELARRTGLSDTTLKYMESGERPDGWEYSPSETTLREVAYAFGGSDAADLLRAYGRDDMARFVEGQDRRGLSVVDDPPPLTPVQEEALRRIMEELTRLLATANVSAHKGAYVSSPARLEIVSSSAA
jgi:transcriptional regulator with XRE-family HTH domain